MLCKQTVTVQSTTDCIRDCEDMVYRKAGGLDTPTGGRIWIRGRNIAELDRKSLTIFRRRNIGFVFQNYSLMSVLNVYDNVVLLVTFDKGKHVDHKYIEELLRELGLWEKRKKYPNELSGGQQQRAALARALTNKPAVILADVKWTKVFDCI